MPLMDQLHRLQAVFRLDRGIAQAGDQLAQQGQVGRVVIDGQNEASPLSHLCLQKWSCHRAGFVQVLRARIPCPLAW